LIEGFAGGLLRRADVRCDQTEEPEESDPEPHA
jgi:hypothetical protein